MANFGFMKQAQAKIEAMKAEKAKFEEASKVLTSIRNDLGILSNDYIYYMNMPISDKQFCDIAEKLIAELQDICYHSVYLQELGLQQYISKDLSDVYQTALLLERGNPNLDPMLCIGYIEALINSEATIEHIEGFGRDLCNSMYRSIIIMGLYLEIENTKDLLKEHQADEFRNFMEEKVAEEEHRGCML